MTITYSFDEGDYDYEVNYDEILNALTDIMSRWTKEDVVSYIVNCDQCVINLTTDFEEELKDYFEDTAYKEFMEYRYD